MKVSGLLESSALYKKFIEERNEILKHKWLESEKAGQDIGFEKGQVIFSRRGRFENEQKCIDALKQRVCVDIPDQHSLVYNILNGGGFKEDAFRHAIKDPDQRWVRSA